MSMSRALLHLSFSEGGGANTAAFISHPTELVVQIQVCEFFMLCISYIFVSYKRIMGKRKLGWLIGTMVPAHARPWSISLLCGESSQLKLLIFQLQQMLTLNLSPRQI